MPVTNGLCYLYVSEYVCIRSDPLHNPICAQTIQMQMIVVTFWVSLWSCKLQYATTGVRLLPVAYSSYQYPIKESLMTVCASRYPVCKLNVH